jgi:hypothetical protein
MRADFLKKIAFSQRKFEALLRSLLEQKNRARKNRGGLLLESGALLAAVGRFARNVPCLGNCLAGDTAFAALGQSFSHPGTNSSP